jgi:hypothetical protein
LENKKRFLETESGKWQIYLEIERFDLKFSEQKDCEIPEKTENL